MENALIIGSSGGIGGAIASALAPRGVAVTGLSRSGDGLDVTDEASVAHHLGALAGPFDLILVASGGLGQPEKSIKALGAAGMADQFALNAMGPMLVLKHAVRLMPRDRRAVFAALSARVGSIGDNALGGWYSYRACQGRAEPDAAHRRDRGYAHASQAVVVALHPGTVETTFTEGYGHDKQPPDQAAARLMSVIDGLGPSDTGGFFDHKGVVVPW